MNKVVADGDTICYKACFATQYQTYDLEEEGLKFRYYKDIQNWMALNFDEEDFPTFIKTEVVEPINYTFHIVDKIMEGIKNDTGINDITIYLSPSSSDNFRYRIPYPVPYKGNRPEKPIHLEDCRKFLRDRYNATVASGVEADDAIGIFATVNTNCVIASVDKDLRQIAGNHYHLDDKTFQNVTEVQGLRALYRQMLMGDRVDNIIGIKGIGIKTAEKLIDHLYSENEMDRVIREQYKIHFKDKWESMYKANYDLLKILRTEEEKEEVRKKYENTISQGQRPEASAVGQGQDSSVVQSA